MVWMAEDKYVALSSSFSQGALGAFRFDPNRTRTSRESEVHK